MRRRPLANRISNRAPAGPPRLRGQRSKQRPPALLALERLEDRTLPSVSMVKDINVAPASPDPAGITEVGGQIFFDAADSAHGRELWVTDGTPSGTRLVKDINPGSADSMGPAPFASSEMANVNGVLLFAADSGTDGAQLWRSDGTLSGTSLVKDIFPNSGPLDFTNLNGTLFFSAFDFTSGQELWRSDGTTAGTFRFADINPGPASSNILGLTNVNGTLYFGANDGTHGEELWRSDGTLQGTFMIQDINPGSGDSVATTSALTSTAVNGTVFFQANDGANGVELWKTTGAPGSAQLVANINPSGGSNPGNLTNVNGTLFFTANDGSSGTEVWRSDGTSGGTFRVADIAPGPASSFPFYLTNLNGTLLFEANDGINGPALWASNGSSGGTTAIRYFDPFTGTPADLVNVNGTVFFAGDDGQTGAELWRSDGTSFGTFEVKDINPGPVPAFFTNFNEPDLTNVNGTLYFSADDGTHSFQLWRSDGTWFGTSRVSAINDGTGDAFDATNPITLTNMNGTMYFRATDGTHPYALWASNGTASGTAMIADPSSGGPSGPYDLTNVSGMLFFGAFGTAGQELWRSDGTAAGTFMVKDIVSGPYSSAPSDLTNVNGTLFFWANDGIHGNELWRSDGTPSGTFMVDDINPGPGDSASFEFAARANIAGLLYFVANDGVHGNELWRSDGTPGGTFLVDDINPGSADGVNPFAFNGLPTPIVGLGSQVLFVANDGTHGSELWRTDGTARGTMMVADIAQGASSSYPASLVLLGNKVLFAANNGSGNSLWGSDGTAQGTTLLGAAGGFNSFDIANANGVAFFSAFGQLWKSDGTVAGTQMVSSKASNPVNIAAINGYVFFYATTPAAGAELWESDGTDAGTVMQGDINPGSGNSFPITQLQRGLVRVDNNLITLFFVATDGAHGLELWRDINATFGGTLTSVSVKSPGRALGRAFAALPTGTTVSITFTVAPDHALDEIFQVPGQPPLISRPGASGTIASISSTDDAYGGFALFAVGVDGNLFRLDASGWALIGGAGLSVSAGRDSSGLADAYFVLADHSLWEYRDSSGWIPDIGGPGSIESVAALRNDRAVAITTDHAVYEFDFHYGWFLLAHGDFAQTVRAEIDAFGNEVLFVETLAHGLWQHDFTGGNHWTRIGYAGSVTQISAGLDAFGLADVFYVTAANQLVEFDDAIGLKFLSAPGTVFELAGAEQNHVFLVLADLSLQQNDASNNSSSQLEPSGSAHG